MFHPEEARSGAKETDRERENGAEGESQNSIKSSGRARQHRGFQVIAVRCGAHVVNVVTYGG